MADAETSPARGNPALLVFGAIAICFAIIGSCAAYFLWPRGDRLGAIDLRGGTPTLSVDVGSGDKLNFRIDTITVGTIGGGYPGDDSDSRSNKVREDLQASKITITFVGNDGVFRRDHEQRRSNGRGWDPEPERHVHQLHPGDRRPRGRITILHLW